MTVHIVLFRPRAGLLPADGRRLIEAFDRALREIPSVRRATVGRRTMMGTAYDELPQPDFPYAAVIEFDDRAGLAAYLAHPAHEDLGRRFWDSLEATQVFDFEMESGVDALRGLT